MHILIKDLRPGAWLTLNGQYAQFVDFAENGQVCVNVAGNNASQSASLASLRPIFINRFILERCGFMPKSNIYTDGHFVITVGDAEKIFSVTGHRVKKPFVMHLLSQLHIFQHIYYTETGKELVFKAGG